MQYKLGKRPARPGYGLRLRDYFHKGVLPPLPTGDIGHQSYVKDWGMLGNGPAKDNPPAIPDGVGDCAIAGPYHAEQLWNAVGGKSINVTTPTVIDTYSAVTGYILGNENTDQGSDPTQVANYWERRGLKDADGKRHRIDAWARLTPNSLEELLYGIYLFDCVGIGVQFPAEWEAATQAGKPWDAIANPTIAGGHYVLGTGTVGGNINVVTWGQNQLLTPTGLMQFCDEMLVYVSRERLLASGKDLNGFNLTQLMADFKALPRV